VNSPNQGENHPNPNPNQRQYLIIKIIIWKIHSVVRRMKKRRRPGRVAQLTGGKGHVHVIRIGAWRTTVESHNIQPAYSNCIVPIGEEFDWNAKPSPNDIIWTESGKLTTGIRHSDDRIKDALSITDSGKNLLIG
jgi:hypothetical protein